MFRITLFSLFAITTISSAEPLLKSPTVGKNAVRVRYTLNETDVKIGHYVNGYVPAGSNASMKPKAPGFPAKVGLATISEMAVVCAKTLKDWGYNPPAGTGQTVFTIPTVVLSGEAELMGKRTAVHVTLKNLRVTVVKSFYGKDDNVEGCDVLIGLPQLLLSSAGQSELWMSFKEKPMAEITYPADKVKKADPAEELGDEMKFDIPDPGKDEIPFRINLGSTDFSFPILQFNGKPTTLKPGQTRFEIRMTTERSAFMSLKFASEYQVKVTKDNGEKVKIGDKESKIAQGLSTNIRIPGFTGAGFKTQLDLFQEEIEYLMDTEVMSSFTLLGPGWFGQSIKNLTLAVGTDGVPRLYGIAVKEATLDPKVKK